jgi:outer membrane murein-binding lipoprotein Lpp
MNLKSISFVKCGSTQNFRTQNNVTKKPKFSSKVQKLHAVIAALRKDRAR